MCRRLCARRRLPAALVVALLALTTASARAVDAPARSSSALAIEQVRVGIGGHFKVGCWTPISVQVRADRPCRVRWSIEVPDPHGNPTVFPGPEAEFTQAGVQTLQTTFRTGRLEGRLRVRVESDEQKAERLLSPVDDQQASLRPALAQSAVLAAALGRPAGLADLPDLDRPVHVAELAAVSHLPAEAAAYDGLDILIVNGNPAFTRPQSVAIRDWVRGGGRLTLAVGRDADAFQNSAIYEWLRAYVPLRGTRTLRELSGLERLAEGQSPIPVSRRQPVTAARIETGDEETGAAPFDGEVLVSELREPLVVRVACGFGRITFVGIDLDQPPLSDWKSLPEVMQKLVFDEFPAPADETRRRGGRLARTGVSDLSTQLLASLEHFPELSRISTWTVMTLLLVYLAIIGPADYFLVHRLFRNPWVTWLSFPLMVCLATALAVWTARTANSPHARLNQIDLVDVDAAAGGEQFVRTQTWMTVYGPQTQRNRVTVAARSIGAAEPAAPGDDETAPFRLSWAGAPETGFGGMYRPGGVEFGRPPYRYSAEGAGIEDLPMAMWSTANLTASRVQQAEDIVESDLSSPGYGVLEGTFTHRLDGPLGDWMLAYGPGVYFSGVDPRTGETAAIEPGVSWSPDDPGVRPQGLHGYLTQTRLKEVERTGASSDRRTEHRLAQTEYDPLSREPAGILRMITFYRSAGGERYTHLDNDSLRRLDCSALLDLNRAVLFARIDQSAAVLNWNGRPLESPRRSTFVRIVLPVRQAR